MADRDAAGKLRIYHTIYRINLAFANIVEHCAALREYGVFTAKFTRLYQSYAQELQAEINQDGWRSWTELNHTTCLGSARCARHAKRSSETPTTSSFRPKSAGRNLQASARSRALDGCEESDRSSKDQVPGR